MNYIVAKISKKYLDKVKKEIEKNKISWNLDDFKTKLQSKDNECLVILDGLTNDFCGFTLFDKKNKICHMFFGQDQCSRDFLVSLNTKYNINKYMVPETDMDHLCFFKDNFVLKSSLKRKFFGNVDGVLFQK